MEDEGNYLSRPRLALFKTFQTYLIKSSQKPIPYTFEEFGHDLGAYALRRTDADKVMGFLNNFGEKLGTSGLEITAEENKSPQAFFKGTNFPKTLIKLDLEFLLAGNRIVASANVTSSICPIDLSDFKGKDYYEACQRILEQIKTNAKPYLDKGKKIESDYNERGITFSGCARISMPSPHHLTLSQITDNIIGVTKAVQDSFTATCRMKQKRLDTIAEMVQELTP